MKVVNSFALLVSSSNDAGLVLLVDAVGILERQHPLARDGLDTGRKSINLDDTPAAHLLEHLILKIQRSLPEHSIRSVKSVLILERLGVRSSDLCWIGREFLVGSNRHKLVEDNKRLGGDRRPRRRQRLVTGRRLEHRTRGDAYACQLSVKEKGVSQTQEGEVRDGR